ncbi:MAG TPA: hypothetical protein VJR27_02010 [Candidatus Saccharimonadales bacterium]|nr:hypothetical protein [Candidatus Saccharimonadales bacterium]
MPRHFENARKRHEVSEERLNRCRSLAKTLHQEWAAQHPEQNGTPTAEQSLAYTRQVRRVAFEVPEVQIPMQAVSAPAEIGRVAIITE